VGNGTSGTDNGNVFAITNFKDANRSQAFTYDTLNRLTSAQNAGTNCTPITLNSKTIYWGNSYSYDAWGNLLQKTITKCGAETLPLLPNVLNRADNGQAPQDGQVPSLNYQYDTAGNMIWDATAQGFTYDPENRITGANGSTYTYDADGNRVEKSNGSTGTLYWYMAPGIVAESDLTGALKSEYVFFDGERIARRDLPSGSVAYYFSDHLKTASVITDSAGNIKSDSDYYPWGGELQFVANDPNHYKFTGKERDTETGLDYFGARYYSNGLGRFITPDPVLVLARTIPVPQRWNRYSYVINQPLGRVDPDGAQDVTVYFMRDTTTDKSTTGRLYIYGNNHTSLEGRYLEPAKGKRIPSGDYHGSYLPKKNSSLVRALFAFPTRIKQGDKIRTYIEAHNGNFPSDTEGCFLYGTFLKKDYVGHSNNFKNLADPFLKRVMEYNEYHSLYDLDINLIVAPGQWDTKPTPPTIPGVPQDSTTVAKGPRGECDFGDCGRVPNAFGPDKRFAPPTDRKERTPER
jgi:RHS repeat-associated protein